MNKIPSLEELLAAGVQFGHKPERTDPRSKKYVFGIRDGVNVINLEKTQEKLSEALDFLTKVSKEGKVIIFVSSKRQAKNIIKKSAQEALCPYVDIRWLGGMLTNFETIKKSIRKLESLEAEIASESFQKLTKKEKLIIQRKKDKLLNSLEGIRKLSTIPDVLFIVDTAKEITAVAEAKQIDIPIVGICDTDANCDLIDYPIPANDDAAKSIELIVKLVKDAIIQGKKPAKIVKQEDIKPKKAMPKEKDLKPKKGIDND